MESLYVFCLTKPIADTQAELVALNNSCERATGGRDNRFIDGPAGEANLSCSSLYLTRRVRNTGAQIKHAALLPAPARRRTPVRCALGHLLCSARRAAYAKRRSLSRAAFFLALSKRDRPAPADCRASLASRAS